MSVNPKLDTIVAEASPAGRGGVSIIRISGPEVKSIAEALLGSLPSPRQARLFSFKDKTNRILDQGLALFFPQPNSFTSEDVLELQGHGGPVIVNLLIKTILDLGARMARPGEFSERAFLNGKLDLAQAEAIADLIHAETEQAARAALRSLQGEFSQKIKALVETVIHLRMYIEAAIDFVEEEIDFLGNEQLRERFLQALQELSDIQQSAQQGSLLRQGLSVVIAGKPNVGKSTLLNLLSGKELAIVTDLPGTTRDLLREQIQIDGIPLHIIDTAGLRETQDPIEQEGIRRAKQEMQQADVILYLIDAKDTLVPVENPANLPLIFIRNKIDLLAETPSLTEYAGKKVVSLSAKTHWGVDLLKQAIKELIGFGAPQESNFSARQRHLDALKRAGNHLEIAFQELSANKAGELVAEDLRQAQKALDEITGEFTTEDLLGKIFSSFCIGK